MNGQKLVLVRRTFDPATATVTLECRSETDAKHAWALGQSANPPESPSLTAVDPTPPAPEEEEWAAVAGAVTGDDGSEVPAVVVTGEMPDGVADQVVIEYRPSGGTDWTEAAVGTPELAKKIISGVTAGDWEVAVSYRRGNRTSGRLVLDPVAVGGYSIPLDEEAFGTALETADVVRTAPGTGGLLAGALAAKDQADRHDIVANSVVAPLVVAPSGTVTTAGATSSASYVLVFDFDVTTDGEPLLFMPSFLAKFWHPGAGDFSITLRFIRVGGGTVRPDVVIDAINGDQYHGWQTPWFTDTPPAGTHNYEVRAWASTDSGFTFRDFSDRQMLVLRLPASTL